MSFSLSRRKRSVGLLILLGLFCIILVIFEASFVFENGLSSVSREGSYSNSNELSNSKRFMMGSEEEKDKAICFVDDDSHRSRAAVCADDASQGSRARRKIEESAKLQLSALDFAAGFETSTSGDGILKFANDAIELGSKLWQELVSDEKNRNNDVDEPPECPTWISVSGDEFGGKGGVMVLPCGLTLGSHITVVGKPRAAGVETNEPKISQFVLELQGLKMVEGEEPPRILHFNPRWKGDSRGKPVIEHNTGFRTTWGTPQRCEGWKSRADEETVDGFVKCEKWIRDDDDESEESKATWWLNRLLGRTKKERIDWPFPFAEEKLFVLTLAAGLEGYHVNVDGRHVTSFPYRIGFTLEDATGLSLNGDVDVLYIFAASLPGFAPQKHLDFSNEWKAPPIPDGPVELFIGVLSAGSHFAERMAMRKSWMQHELIKSSNVAARFFVALHGRKETNEEIKKEAEFFGDIVIVPLMDHYDLAALKTLAICEFGVRTVSADYIMKSDDDTFVRVDAVIDEAKKVRDKRSLYLGKISYNHQPVRSGGKWGATPEEWPEGVGFPPYASGTGYIISSDVANSILSKFEKHELKLFRLEDVCVATWVEKVNKSTPVEYVDSSRFCTTGCREDYIIAHYQSPGQMICLWNKLRQQGRPSCCDVK